MRETIDEKTLDRLFVDFKKVLRYSTPYNTH